MQMGKHFKPLNSAVVGRDEMARVIAEAWDANLLPQKEACHALGINQGHFSRLVRGQFKRPAGHAIELFAYAKVRLSAANRGGEDLVQLRERLTEQLLKAWDHTAEGARALGSILDGLQKLRKAAADEAP
jgi:predicted XRE-type DNA-binding protein